MPAPQAIEGLFQAVQEAATTALWSQGVTLSRGENSFVTDRLSEDEVVLHVRQGHQALTSKVTLFVSEADWDCDCGSSANPCPHVVASVILLKRGTLQAAPNEGPGAMPEVARLHYSFVRSKEGLSFEVHLVKGDDRRRLEIPLTNYVGGLQAGRIQGPAVMATKADYAVDAALRSYRSGSPLDRPRLEALFKAFEGDLKLFLDGVAVKTTTDVLILRVECVDEMEGYRLRRIKNNSVTESFAHGLVLCGDTLKLAARTTLTPEEVRWVANEGSYWGPEQEKRLCAEILPALRKKIPLEIHSLKLPQTLEIKPRLTLALEKEKTLGGEACLSVLANVVYGDPPLAQLNYQTLELTPLRNVVGARVNQLVKRDADAERTLMTRLARDLNLQPGRRIQMTGLAAVEFTFKVKDWERTGDGFDHYHPGKRTLQPDFAIEAGAQCSFDVNFQLLGATGGEGAGAKADFARVFQAWQRGDDYVPLLDGSWAQLPKDWMQRYARKVQAFLVAREAGKEVAACRLPELAALCEETGQDCPDTIKNLKGCLEDFRGIPESALPADLRADLRPYQRKGVNWLCFLRESRLGALLADDMGLGKTLQMLCALKGRSLVVAPTSVLFNWAAEIAKFRPALKICIYYGAKRELDAEAEVVLTSYGLLRLDHEQLTKEKWDTIVLDEAQTIKNPESQVARAAHALNGSFRATLTGTPVENRLDDLWSQFHFINPGLLGGRESFLENYARPIGRGEAEPSKRLRALIKPFILRRLKRDVAPELPPRTETVLHCELGEDERAAYETLLASTRADVMQGLESGASMIKALELILRLRQACCHRALIPGFEAETSSKLDLLMESLEESLAEGHKSLIFSQWTSYLDLIGAELQRREIRFSRIDGSTQNRQGLVNEFQSAGGPPLMLISLKAGGVGLTLTAADHVYIMDPWWNPAVEDQAADRAHRIGQQNPVMIHRLVARETIEERILALQEKKKDLARAVLDEGGAALGLTKQDILSLLA